MKEEYIPNYNVYKSVDLIDVWLRIDRRNNLKKLKALEEEIKLRFSIYGEINLNDEYVKSQIILKIKEEDPDKVYTLLHKKDYFLFKKLIIIYTNIFLIPVLYLYFSGQMRIATLVLIFSVSLITITNLIISVRTGIISDKISDVYEDKEPNKFFINQIFYFLCFLLSVTIASLILLNVISI